ncbi:MAG: hypothetical protein KDD92_18550, partial [Caldilineaceae bacterium]|nr:hypothetical protein [Caldilineaceae bacterium]
TGTEAGPYDGTLREGRVVVPARRVRRPEPCPVAGLRTGTEAGPYDGTLREGRVVVPARRVRRPEPCPIAGLRTGTEAGPYGGSPHARSVGAGVLNPVRS